MFSHPNNLQAFNLLWPATNSSFSVTTIGCNSPISSIFFVFHHLWYNQGEPYHKDYKDNSDYQLAVLPIVRKNPKQFLLLCRGHHDKVEWGKSLKDEGKWKRFCKARKMSQWNVKWKVAQHNLKIVWTD